MEEVPLCHTTRTQDGGNKKLSARIVSMKILKQANVVSSHTAA